MCDTSVTSTFVNFMPFFVMSVNAAYAVESVVAMVTHMVVLATSTV